MTKAVHITAEKEEGMLVVKLLLSLTIRFQLYFLTDLLKRE